MKVQILDVTPDMAKEYLIKNDSNRKINKLQLGMLVRAINDNQWRLTHQGIAFYVDGELADGQHRLNAVIETGRTLKMAVFTGVDRDQETVMAIDCGKARTFRDGARITGIDITYSHIAIAKGFEYGYLGDKRVKLTHIEQYDLCVKHQGKLDTSELLFPKNIQRVTLSPVRVAAVKIYNEGFNADIIESFCRTLSTGEYSEPLYANAIKLRNRLQSQRYGCAATHREAHNITYNAISRTIRGEKIAKLNAANP